MQVEFEPFGPVNRSVAERLWQLYRHDLSAVTGSLPDAGGRFPPGRLPRYFEQPDTPGFLLRSGASPVGFCGVLPHDGFRSIGDFFVVHAARRTGVGEAAATHLIRSLPGPWGIAFQDANAGAARFWPRVATGLVGTEWTEEHRPVPGKPDVPPDHWIRFVLR